MAAFTLAALLSEVTNDPAALGYAGKTDSAIVALINTVTATQIFRNDVTGKEILTAIVAADAASMTQLQWVRLNTFLAIGVLDATVSNLRTIFLGIFTGLTNTITALTALAQRPGTRAEVLWGPGVTITETLLNNMRHP